MKSNLCLLPLVVGLALLAGCDAEEKEHEELPVQGKGLFEKNKGVLLPPEMKRDLGIETAELTERPFSTQTLRPAQVFRAASPPRPGAAVLPMDASTPGLVRGQSLQLRGPGLPEGSDRTGEVVHLELDASLNPIEAVLAWTNSTPAWSVGTSLTVMLTGPQTNLAQAIPISAVIDGVSGPFVYAANGEHYVRTPIQLGRSGETWVEVTGGLYPGDLVVTHGAGTLWMIELCALKGGTPCCPVPGRKVDP